MLCGSLWRCGGGGSREGARVARRAVRGERPCACTLLLQFSLSPLPSARPPALCAPLRALVWRGLGGTWQPLRPGRGHVGLAKDFAYTSLPLLQKATGADSPDWAGGEGEVAGSNANSRALLACDDCSKHHIGHRVSRGLSIDPSISLRSQSLSPLQRLLWAGLVKLNELVGKRCDVCGVPLEADKAEAERVER